MKFFRVLLISMPLLITACGSHNGESELPDGNILTSEADLLKIVAFDTWTAVEISAPWSDCPIAKYALIEDFEEDLKQVPNDFIKIKVPLSECAVFSSVYTSAINELGAIEKVKGVADGSYYPSSDTVKTLLSQGKIKDVGSSMYPSLEQLADLSLDAIFLSPFQGSENKDLERLNTHLIWMSDYLESTPLGRAEWILLFGELFGKKDEAHSILNDVKENYRRISEMCSNAESHPTVIVEKPLSGIWYVPAGNSYIATMISDAGGIYPWNDTEGSGSIPLDESAVIDKGYNADIWLIKDIHNLTKQDLKLELPRSKAFKAFDNHTYYCNTVSTPYYNIIAFHPDRILKDYAVMFHPDIFNNNSLEFYSLLK